MGYHIIQNTPFPLPTLEFILYRQTRSKSKTEYKVSFLKLNFLKTYSFLKI